MAVTGDRHFIKKKNWEKENANKENKLNDETLEQILKQIAIIIIGKYQCYRTIWYIIIERYWSRIINLKKLIIIVSIAIDILFFDVIKNHP